MVFQGSLPGLRIGTNPAPSPRATAPPGMNPRASIAVTTSGGRSAQWLHTFSTMPLNMTLSASKGVMSLKTIPGCGKSGTSRISRRRCSSVRPTDRDLGEGFGDQVAEILGAAEHRSERIRSCVSEERRPQQRRSAAWAPKIRRGARAGGPSSYDSTEVFQGQGETVLERDLRLPAQELAGVGDVRPALLGIINRQGAELDRAA